MCRLGASLYLECRIYADFNPLRRFETKPIIVHTALSLKVVGPLMMNLNRNA